MNKAVIWGGIALFLLVLFLIGIASPKAKDEKSDVKVDPRSACEAAIQALADSGAEPRTPKECEGLTDAEIGEIARRIYAEKDREDRS